MKKIFERSAVVFLTLGLVFWLSSCLDSGNTTDPVVELLKDIETIDKYLADNNLTAIKDPTGVRIVVTQTGSNELPAMVTNTVDVDYVGKVFDTGATFEAGNAKGVLRGFIGGWQIALALIPPGTHATLYIPPYWAYGDVDKGSIPANSILTFDIAFKDKVETSQESQKLVADTIAIDTYLTSKSIDAVKDSSGLRYVVTQLGTGAPATSLYNKVKLNFKYKILTDDTKVVAQGEREPSSDFDSRVADYIHGMKIALFQLPTGSKATLYVPSGLAYGPSEAKDGGITVVPANSNLIVEFEFVGIVEP